jgi:hypothetical protein
VVGAFFFVGATAGAQVVVPPGSEVPIPVRTADSVTVRRDTIQAPFGRAPGTRTADIGPQYEWNREELFASGALNLAELIERVPGLTTFRTGWVASPKFAALNGDLNRIRVYYDGIEMDNLDPKGGALLDLNTIELWALESVQMERFANELKIHLRTWRVDRTSPSTRTDVFTGDENTQYYRGYYGKRFGSGFGLQLGGQHFSTRAARLGGGGDALSFMGRIGIARRMWSIDAFALQRGSSRTLQPTFSTTDGLSLPAYDGNHNLAYLRAAVGNAAGGPWAQIVASHMRFSDRSPHITPAEAASRRLVADTTDTTVNRVQYVASAGFSRGPLRASIQDRVRAFDDETYHTPAARVSLAGRLGVASVYAESNEFSRAARGDVIARFTPVSFLAVAGAYSFSEPFDSVAATAPPAWTAARLEAGIRVIRPWLIGGFITRDTALLVGAVMVDTAYQPVATGKRQGLYAGLRGQLYKDLNIDVVGTQWDSAGYYQPRYQARAEVNLTTRWLSRFPSGSFGLKAAFVHDYRGRVRFPTAVGDRITPASGIVSGLLEIRIGNGVASYQVRNLTNASYQIFPDFFMPRTINIYGIRWDFWN